MSSEPAHQLTTFEQGTYKSEHTPHCLGDALGPAQSGTNECPTRPESASGSQNKKTNHWPANIKHTRTMIYWVHRSVKTL